MKTIVEVAQNLIKPFINSEDKKYAANIAPVETSPATAVHTAGTQLIYNGVLYNVTANIAADDPLATTGAGANIALADKVTEQISSQKQALSDEVVTRAELGAHNLLFYDMDRIRNDFINVGSWNGNVYTRSDVHYTFNSDGTISVSTESAGASADSQLNLMYFNDSSGNPKQKNQFLGKTITMTGCPSGGSVSSYYLRYVNATGSYAATDYGSGITFTVGEYVSGRAQLVTIVIKSGTIITTPLVFKPMIRLATDADTTYRPYVPTNDELVSYRDNAVLGAKNIYLNKYAGRTNNDITFAADSTDPNKIRITGTHNGTDAYFMNSSSAENISYQKLVRKGTYKIRATGNSNIGIYAFYKYVGSAEAHTTERAITNDVVFTLEEDAYLVLLIRVGGGTNLDTYAYLSITLATDTDPTYAPFAMTNRELTEVAQQVEAGYVLVSSAEVVASVTADGIKTNQEILNELRLAFDTWLANNTDKYCKIVAGNWGGAYLVPNRATLLGFYNASYSNNMIFTGYSATAQHYTMYDSRISRTLNDNNYYYMEDGVNSARTSNVPASGTTFAIYGDVYTKVS